MLWETYWLYLAAVFVFFATPPDTSQLLVISNSARHGLRRSCWTIVGDLTANCVQMTAAAFGLAATIATSAQTFQMIKWAGVAYLAWIGLRLMLSSGETATAPPVESKSGWQLFRQGFITSSANPFAVVFFAALFPQFLDPSLATAPQLAILGSTYLVVDGFILLGWGWLSAYAAHGIRTLSSDWINRGCGAMMIGAAALLASKDLQPEQP